MIYYIKHLKDIIGNNYLGIDLPHTIIDKFLNDLKDILEDVDYNKFTENQIKRDGGSYHITVINVADYNRISKIMGIDKFINSLDPILKYPIDDLKLIGVGRSQKNENTSFYVVCNSSKLKSIRSRFELTEVDFHSTIGFNYKDVFGVRKNEVFQRENKFIQLLRLCFYNNENWNFIKDISNFDLCERSEVIPILISDTILRVMCDGYYLDITYSDNSKGFRIMSQYSVNDDSKRMSETEISRILNKK